MSLRQAAQRALEALENDAMQRTYAGGVRIANAAIALRAALAEPEQEPVATKQMLRWVEHLKRLSDDGQHMSIPGLSSGACWELAIELEQFIKNTAPTPRKPLTDEEIHQVIRAGNYDSMEQFARAIERAHGIGK